MDNSMRTGMTTHAGRSLLQEAARFSNEGKAVGEGGDDFGGDQLACL